MSNITIQQNADGTGTIIITGVSIIPYVTPTPQPTFANVAVTGILADGTNISLQLQAGERKPLVTGKLIGSAIYHSDGRSVCIENGYMGTTSPLSGTFVITANSKQLFNGSLTIGPAKRTRPFWVNSPTAKALPDWSAWPKRVGGETSSLYAAYIAADNSPMGCGIANHKFETTGERPDLGGPLWDVAMMTNPNAENATVVRGMSDAAAVWAVHWIDPTTNEMVNMAGNPYIADYANVWGKNGNPIVPYTQDDSGLSLSQCQAHATYFSAAAAELYGTDYDREEVAFWANYYGSLWQNPEYRSANGGTTFKSCQVRGKARNIEYLLLATKYAPTKWQPLFAQWIKDSIADGTARAKAQTGLAIDQITGQSGSEANLYSVWNQQILIAALGRALDYGYTDAQWLLDYYATPLLDAILGDGQTPVICHEWTSGYKYQWIKSDGTFVATYRDVCELRASSNTAFATALTATEDSVARIKALEPTNSQYQAGDFDGYPWSPTGYPCYVRVAVVALANHATDQVRAQAAMSKLLKYYRADHSTDAKYDIVPVSYVPTTS